ncbi:LOG family protein [Rhizobiaceae bacterium BDR2-2]|uniref:AMP nucleosidase n=1 Tax=Ectorhizobium quercum TaxID=2965071 RepID=A0AAE3MY47_9HYPH|nr:LOG family protein [Ectorhizobium quercum]MCX8995805.1 LOG family protein [Ectorhizobium quercum]
MAKNDKAVERKPGRRWDPLQSSSSDKRRAEDVPKTPQTLSPAYRLAYADTDFLLRPELQPVRLQLELMKVDMALAEMNIRSTIVIFGGARIPAPGAEAWAARNPVQRANLEGASRYYEEARKFAQLCSDHARRSDFEEFVVVTGGGPGVMEAGNKGAADAGAPTIGLNIVLPHEQAPNHFVTPELSFNFHYFAIRKMHFLKRAKAITVFPGGFGTLDELFETLTLIQTGRMAPVPLILFGEAFWRRIIDFEALSEFGTIAPEDIELVNFAETAEDGWRIIQDFYGMSGEA